MQLAGNNQLEPGLTATKGKENVPLPIFPDYCDDLMDLLRSHGREALIAA